jgi:hypothetical protein
MVAVAKRFVGRERKWIEGFNGVQRVVTQRCLSLFALCWNRFFL